MSTTNDQGRTASAGFLHRTLMLTLTLFLAVALTQCADKEDEPEPTPTPGPQTPTGQPGPPITLGETSGSTAGEVALSGVAAVYGEEPFLWLVPSDKNDGDGRYPVYVERTGTATASFIVPAHPVNPFDGGTVQLILESEDGSVESEPVSFVIGALEPAPGTYMEMLDKFQTAMEHLSRVFGAEPEALLNEDPAKMHPVFRALAGGLHMIANPDYPDNLRAIVNGESPYFGADYLSSDELEIMDAVLVASGFAESFDEFLDQVMTIEIPSDDEEKFTLRGPQKVIRHVYDLHKDMEMRAELDDFQEGYFGWALNNTGTLAGGLAAAVPATAPITGPVAITITVLQILMDLNRGTLPSDLNGFELNAAPHEYYEDEDVEGEWTAVLVASSTGYVLNLPTALGAVPGLGKLGKVVAEQARKNPAAREAVERTFNFFLEVIRSRLAADIESGIRFEPEVWEVPVHLGPGRRLAEARTLEISMRTVFSEKGGAPFRFKDQDESRYLPLEVGGSEILIKTKEGMFAGAFASNTQYLEVLPFEVHVVGSPFCLEEGESMVIEAQVRNAIDQSVSWSSPGSGLTILDLGNSLAHITANQTGIHEVYATATASTGARASGSPVREGGGVVNVPEINPEVLEISPGASCVEQNGTIQFSATEGEGGCNNKSGMSSGFGVAPGTQRTTSSSAGIQGGARGAATGPKSNISWSASSGSISAEGLFTAPAQAGIVTVTASIGNQSRSVLINVAESCDCWWMAEVVGPTPLTHLAGSESIISTPPGGGMQISVQSESGSLFSYAGGVDATIPRGATGSWIGGSAVGYTHGGQYAFGSDGTTELLIEEHVSTGGGVFGGGFRLKGQVRGTVGFFVVNGEDRDPEIPGVVSVYFGGNYTIADPVLGSTAICIPGFKRAP